MIKTPDQSAQVIADSLLERAMDLDQGRPVDDTSVAVLRVLDQASDSVRRMAVRIPLEPQYY